MYARRNNQQSSGLTKAENHFYEVVEVLLYIYMYLVFRK